MEFNTNKSKQLAFLLRHDHNYELESGGWRNMDDLCQRYSFTTEEIIDIVSNDSKGRFEVNLDKTKVRALYGHSVNVDLSLHSQVPPGVLYHGTALKYIDSIKKYGLRQKSRQYVHLTEDKDLAILTGTRHGEAVLLVIDSYSMSKCGFLFFKASEGIWLTKEVPSLYIQEIQ